MRIYILVLFFVILTGCANKHLSQNDSSHDDLARSNLAQVAQDYFNVYSQRNDFERFISFYANNAKFEDIIYGNSFDNKTEIKGFLAWDKGEFKLLSGQKALTVTTQVISENTVVTEGYFHEFTYDGQKLGPWLFVIIQEFDDNNKIIKQVDWINYTPRNNFLGGKNMNDKLTLQ